MFVHVVCAVTWVGSVFAAQAVAWRLLRANQIPDLVKLAGQLEILAKVLGPAVVLLLAAGILLVEKLGIGYGTTWVVIGIGAYASSILVGGVAADRVSKHVDALVAEHGADSPAVATEVRKLWTIARIDLVILLIAVWAMTWKPGS